MRKTSAPVKVITKRYNEQVDKALERGCAATQVFVNLSLNWGDEIREISIGIVEGVLYLTVVHTDTETGNIRLTSARRANKWERGCYEKTLR